MTKLIIMKKKDDPQGILRVSIGGTKDARYIVYRGNLQEIKSMMTQCYRAVMAVEKDLEISPDEEINNG